MKVFANGILKTLILLAKVIVLRATNDPEVLEQLWIQLYRYLPKPSMAPQLPSDLPLNVKLSLMIEGAELQNLNGRLVSHVSLLIFTEWPATDPRVTDSRLLEVTSSGGIHLDTDKVWHPELSIIGGYIHRRLTQRLELRPATDSRKPEGRSSEGGAPLSNGMTSRAIDSVTSLRSPDGETSANDDDGGMIVGSGKQILSMKRRTRLPLVKPGVSGDGMRFTLTERVYVEVACSQPKRFTHIGATACPILIRQEGSTQEQTTLKWSDLKSCLISDDVERKTIHITTSQMLISRVDNHGSEHSLGVHLCFSQTASVLQSAILPLLIVLLALQLMWTESACTSGWACWLQGCLHLVLVLVWSWLTEVRRAGGFGLVDTWSLICFVFISLATLCCQLQQRWIFRLLNRRRLRQQRLFAESATATLQGNTAMPVPGCGPACKVEPGRCCAALTGGICPEADCIMHNCGLPGYTDGSILNKQTGACNSCATGSGTRPTIIGRISTSNTSNPNSGNNGSGSSPLPFGFKPTSQMCASNTEAYGDGYLCSTGSDSATGGTFQGLRWNGDRKNTNITGNNDIGANVDMLCPNLAANTCSTCRAQSGPTASGVFLTRNQEAGLFGLTSLCNSSTHKLPVNYAVYVVKIAITSLFFVTATIFWIGVLVQGILPDICVGRTVCQAVTPQFV